ncbi:MBL fold metallo-hydrolase [Labedella phragmitis]|uniref:MBL fold metallo-hydrolase n=1 Tax=Labedella phragmitis TaxID=2498849 RepID=A0A3S4AMK2_9MICO|nr:ComEC/Rec2 family competence protein [Labedella phragmitis]RWZ51858.1 MBL fold metallo-hydrolase [Labedella phragmitis]
MTDLRLVAPAVAAWVTAFACTQARDLPTMAPIGLGVLTAGLVVGVLLAVGRGTTRRPRLIEAIATAAVSMAVAFAVCLSVSVSSSDRRPVALEAAVASGRTIDVRVELAATPRPLDSPSNLVVVDVDVTAVRNDGGSIDGLRAPAVLFMTQPDRAVGDAQVLTLSARVDDGRAGDRESFVLRAIGEPAVESAGHDLDPASVLRSGFAELARDLPGDGGALLPGLAVGDTSLVDDALDDRMTSASLSHLTAVSGANCALVVGAVFALLGLIGAPRWLRVAAALLALSGFVALVTPEPSVVRAAVMAAIVLVSIAAGRPSAGVPVLGLAVVLVLMTDPWLCRSFGFALSAAATAGLLLLSGPLARALERVLPAPLALALALPIAAQLACQPIIVLLDPAVPLLGVPANMLAAPAAPVATVLGMLSCLLVPIAPSLAAGLAMLAWLPAQWIAGVATAAATAPVGTVPWPSGLAGAAVWLAVLTTVAVGVGARAVRVRRAAVVLLVSAAVVSGVGLSGARSGEVWSRPGDWAIAMCDVGQGDAVLVRSGGSTALVDTGPDPEMLDDCLRDLGIAHVDLLVLSHFDLDHVGGVAAVTGRTTEVLHQPVVEAADAALLRRLEAGGASLVETTAGDQGVLGDVPWRALWPPPDRPRYTGNDGSVVIEFRGALDAIFLGDLGKDSELALLADGHVGTGYAVVKFAHHGSADQYPALYEHIGARLALVSCGRENDYGHPTVTALDLLRKEGTAVARSDRDGTTLVAVRGNALATWSSGPLEPG